MDGVLEIWSYWPEASFLVRGKESVPEWCQLLSEIDF